MTTHGPLSAAYTAAADRFSQGDVEGFGELLAEDCVFESSRGLVGASRAEIVAALTATKAAIGWERHEVIGSHEQDDVLAVLGRNVFADGSITYPAGCARFVDGKITELRAVGGLPASMR